MAKTWTANYTLNFGETILYWVLYSIIFAISLLPFWLIYIMSDILFLIIKAIGYRKHVIYKNLRNSFPEKSEKDIITIRNKFYHYFCDYIFETIKLATISKNTMLKRMQYNGVEIINDAIKQGRPVALYLGHYANWEWVTSIGLHLHEKAFGCQVYHVIESKVMDKIMLKLRSRMGTSNIPRADILRRLITEIRNGKAPVVGFISDQTPIVNSMPYWVDFLNQETPFINGTERLIKKFNMRPVYFDIRKLKRGYFEINIKIITDTPKDIEDGKITVLYAKALEQTINRQPELWLWSHNRWKRKKNEFFGH